MKWGGVVAGPMRLHDISPLISEDLDVWPGDVRYSGAKALEIGAGANIDLGSMTTTFHVGAHADAPNHYVAGGADIASVSLEPYFGACEVRDVEVGRGERVRPEHLLGEVRTPRVLLRTGTFPDPESWNDDFAALAPELVDHLADQGCLLVGIDTPSVDLFDDKVLLAHQRVAARGMANLEGLVLHGIPAGTYTLAAFPLKIRMADAAPVRAVLIEE